MNYQTKIKKAHKINYSFFSDNSLGFIDSYFKSRKNLISQIDKLLKKKTIHKVEFKDNFKPKNEAYQSISAENDPGT